MMIQLLCVYNQKNCRGWDENILYIQHSYNRSQHNSTSKSLSEVYDGFYPSAPIDLVHRPTNLIKTDHEHREIEKELKFKDRVCDIHKQAHDMFQ